MLIFFLSMGFLQVSSGITNRLRGATHNKQAFQLAEAGLAEAYVGLSGMKTGNVGSMEAPAAIGDGLLWVEATELGNDIVELESTGMYGSGRVTLGLAVQRERINLSSLGIFANLDFKVNPNSLLDSYDSSKGTYGEHLAAGTNNQATLGSNGDVILGSGVSVMGDVISGVGGAISVGSGASISGTQAERPAGTALPPVEVPVMTMTAPRSVSGGDTLVIPPGKLGIESLSVGSGSRAILTGPSTLVIGDLSLANLGTLTFDNSGGPIDIYLTGDLSMASGSLASTISDDPNMVTVQVASDDSRSVVFGAKALFYGQIYAPLAKVKIQPNFELFGSLVANDIEITSQSKLHFDLNTIPSRRDVLPDMWAWRVLDVPDAVAGNSMDPFVLLNLDKSLLLPPANAHQDQLLSVVYKDAMDVTQIYNGMESLFDWSKVGSVTSGSRNGEGFAVVVSKEDPQGEQGEPLTAKEEAQLGMIESAATSADVLSRLDADYPVSERILLEAIQRVPAMSSSDLFDLLVAYGPNSAGYPGGRSPTKAADDLLMAAITQPAFADKELSWILEQNSPLAAEVLDAAVNRTPPMSRPTLNTVLRYQ